MKLTLFVFKNKPTWEFENGYTHKMKMIYDEHNYPIKIVLRPNLIGHLVRIKQMLEIPATETKLWGLPNV